MLPHRRRIVTCGRPYFRFDLRVLGLDDLTPASHTVNIYFDSDLPPRIVVLSGTVETIARTTLDGLLNLSVHVGVADADVAVSVRVTLLRPGGDLDSNGWPIGYFDQVAGSMPNLERAPQGQFEQRLAIDSGRRAGQ